MKKLSDFTYGIVGLGLMGGSLAKAIRENVLDRPSATGKILGSDINNVSLELSVKEHIIDESYCIDDVDRMLEKCDFVYICLYPHTTVDFLIQHKNAFKSGAVVSDISGVKEIIAENVDKFRREDVDFIPGHPMAGSEKEGYIHSSGQVFKNHNYIVMPLPETKKEDLDMFKLLITSMGFTRIVETDYSIHDHKIAFTSQLCHVIASALVNSAEDTEITAFGGGSFEDLTRIAMINAPLWTELFIANKKELLGHIDKFESSLSSIKKMIENNDAEGLTSCLEDVRTKRVAMSRVDMKVQ